uniref:Uncharacterized protein n=1 Tax=Arundo donax TaxID=35708 RepID=A0A0A9EHR1_ARUDO
MNIPFFSLFYASAAVASDAGMVILLSAILCDIWY